MPEKNRRKTEIGGKTGRVWLVGAGPGAADLITKRGCELLKKADVVVYDALILPETLQMIPEGVEKIYVGKRAGAHSVPQEEIQRILIREAGLGKRVVRLKGGDPFVFGRGGEEALALTEQGIPCEVVPGITSAVAVPEAFGIPVTHRGLAASFTVINGHGQAAGGILSATETEAQSSTFGAACPADYEALVRTGGTLVFLMGLSAAGEICRRLQDAGMRADMPAAALSKGTTAKQRMVLSTVGSLEEDIRAAELEAPAILVVGKVCALAHAWNCGTPGEKSGIFAGAEAPDKKKTAIAVTGQAKASVEDAPSEGKKTTVVVTRQAEKAEAFSSCLKAMGANVWELPAIRIEQPGEGVREEVFRAFRELCGGTKQPGATPVWLVFTSANGVNAFFDLLGLAGLDMRQLLCGGEKRFAAVGPKTAKALRTRGILADLVPEEYTGAALGEALRAKIEEEKSENPGRVRSTESCGKEDLKDGGGMIPKVWVFAAKQTGGDLEASLGACHIPFRSVSVYETVSAVRPEEAEKLEKQMRAGGERFIFTFTSASCVRNLAEALVKEEKLVKQPEASDAGAAIKKSGMRCTEILRGQIAVCIGKKTAKAAVEAGMRAVVSKESTEESMLEEVRRVMCEIPVSG